MTDVIFYEKPGCANNARQKQLLEKAGHRLEVRDLLAEAWTGEGLRSYFGARPVTEWFNKAAPRVKNSEVDPTRLTEVEALALMLAEPILIRRPLIEALGARVAGFDQAAIDAWIGLAEGSAENRDLETCRRSAPAKAAPADENAAPESISP
jgi:nitrogenase-associated protein